MLLAESAQFYSYVVKCTQMMILRKHLTQAENMTEEACYSPWRRKCSENGGSDGEEKCVTVYESSCLTRYEEKNSGEEGTNNKKFVALTKCDKIPQTLCSDKKCQLVQVSIIMNHDPVTNKNNIKPYVTLRRQFSLTNCQDQSHMI